MESLQEEERNIQIQSKKRIQHLQDLFKIQTLADVKYEEWSRIRLDRLIVDYMLRSGFSESAQQLAKAKGIDDLVDTGTFVQCQRIAESLRRGDAKEALQWCGENKVALKKNQVRPRDMPFFFFFSLRVAKEIIASQNTLEFELRLQQYIELVRTRKPAKMIEAMQHAKKYLSQHLETQSVEIHRAAGLLAFPKDTDAEPYKVRFR